MWLLPYLLVYVFVYRWCFVMKLWDVVLFPMHWQICLFSRVSENHILEDVNKCVIALQERDVDGLDRTAGAIRGRAARVVHVVTSEMDNYEPGVYTEKVLEATKLLTDTGRVTANVESQCRIRATRCTQRGIRFQLLFINIYLQQHISACNRKQTSGNRDIIFTSAL